MMAHTIEVVLDKTSSPTLASLNGTIFTISIPAPVLPVVVAQASGSPPAVVDPASLGFPELTLTFSAPQFTQLSSNLASLSGSGGGGGAEAANQVGIGAGSWSADIQQIILDALDATNNLLQELENQPGGWLPQIKDAPRGRCAFGPHPTDGEEQEQLEEESFFPEESPWLGDTPAKLDNLCGSPPDWLDQLCQALESAPQIRMKDEG